MLISIDGPAGSGKTTLTELIARYSENGIAIPVAKTHSEQEPPNEDVRKIVNWMDSAKEIKDFFKSDHYDIDAQSDISFLLYTLRLKMIQANKKIMEHEHVVVDNFFYPIWMFEKEFFKDYLKCLRTFVEFPDVSFFLKLKTRVAFQRRMGDSGIETQLVYDRTAPEFIETDKKIEHFIRKASTDIPNFNVLAGTHKLPTLLDTSMDIIKRMNKE